MKRFKKITEGLYRGSAPSVNEVRHLHNYIGINKIVSLDRETGEAIDHICHQLGIEHVMMPLNGRKEPLQRLLDQDLYSLLMDGGPTFIHCAEGKDRTGLVSAMFKCKYMGWTYQEAMDEAVSLDFGKGVNPFIVGLYSNVLKKVCKQQDSEDESHVEDKSIVSNQRSYKERDDGRGSYLDQATQGSFAPFMSKTRQYPYDNVYNYVNDQYPTRDNWDHDLTPYEEDEDKHNVPLVGVYDSGGGFRGFGPVEPLGGFINA